MTVALTEEQLGEYRHQGWKVFQPGFDISYKSQWNTPWFFIREFYQNALDEHDIAGVKTKPTITMTPKGIVIEDRGRGLGAESLLLRETKGEQDLRGRFGEGLKFACIAAVRQGYVVHIESPSIAIEAHSSQQVMGKTEVNLLTFIYKEQERATVGTRVTIEGYTGELYKDRFTTFLGKPILEMSKAIGRFERHEAVYMEPKGRLYVGDIFIRDLDAPSNYSYNLWGLELNPDRISEVNYSNLVTQVAKLWGSLNKTDIATLVMKAMTTKGTFESDLGWGDVRISCRQCWEEAWQMLFGRRAVLRTNPNLSKLAEAYGYKSVGEGWGYKVLYFLRYLVPTDESIVSTRMKELTSPKIIKDSYLTKAELTNLNLVRFLSDSCGSCTHQGSKPSIVAAKIPPDPRTGDVILGLCSLDEGTIYLSEGILDNDEDALSTFYHEMGHWVGGPDAVDGSMEHTKAVQRVASTMSMIILAKSSQIAEILGLAVPPISPPVVPPTGIPSKISEFAAQYSLDELKHMARERGVADVGTKRDLASKLITASLSPATSGESSGKFPQIAYKPTLRIRFN